MKLLFFLRNPLWKVILRLGLVDFVLDIYWREKKNKWRKIEESGYINKPKSIWFEPTIRCNLNCLFCHQKERRKFLKREMNIKEIDRFLTKMQRWGINRIEMIGGEIFVRRDIFEILDLIEEKKMQVKLGTNGILDDKNIERLKKYKCIESIAVSIDGPPHIHNKLRNSPIAYKKAVEFFKKTSSAGFLKVIYSLLLPDDKERIEFLIKLAKELKADRITFMPEMFYSQKDLEKSKEYLEMGDEEHIFVEVCERENRIEDMIKAIFWVKKFRKKYAVFAPIFPRASYKYPQEFFSYSLHKRRKLICRHFYSFTVIENGDVFICPFIHKKVGNVLEGDPQQIWNNEIMRNLRTKILKNNLLPICRKCCAVDYVE